MIQMCPISVIHRAPRVIAVICGKGRARNDFGSGSESPFMFVVPGAAAHGVMGWGDGRIVQVVFFSEARADVSFAKVVLN